MARQKAKHGISWITSETDCRGKITISFGKKLDSKPIRKRNWFILALENGRNNNQSWFPGCLVFGQLKVQVEVKESESIESGTIQVLEPNEQVEIENLIDIRETPESGWYKVLLADNSEGYIQIKQDGKNVADLYYSSHV